MADRFSYGGYFGLPYPYMVSPPYPISPPHPPPYFVNHPVGSIEGGYDPMNSQSSYHRSPVDWSYDPSYHGYYSSQASSLSNYDNMRLVSARGEGSYKDMNSQRGFHSGRGTSSDSVLEPLSETQDLNFVPGYSSANAAPMSSLTENPVRNPQEPFYNPIMPSDVYASSNPGCDKRGNKSGVPDSPVEPSKSVKDSIPSYPKSSLKPQTLFNGSQTRADGRSFPSNSDSLDKGVQSNLNGSSIEPVYSCEVLGCGKAGCIKPLSKNPDLSSHVVRPADSKSSQSSDSQRLNIKSTVSVSKVKQEESDEHRSENHLMATSEGPSAPTVFSMGRTIQVAKKADDGKTQSTVANQSNEVVIAQKRATLKECFERMKSYTNTPQLTDLGIKSSGSNVDDISTCQSPESLVRDQKPCNLQEQMNGDKKTILTDLGIKSSSLNVDDFSTDQSPERHLHDQEDVVSSPRVSSVVKAMHKLSQVLVYECVNNGSQLSEELLKNLDGVVENISKCSKINFDDTSIAEQASLPNQPIHISCIKVINQNGASKMVIKDIPGFNVKPLNSFGSEEPTDKTEMTQSIKNILASNLPEGEENHPQTLFYKNLWIEAEAALCSTTFMARYHRAKNGISTLGSQKREISADASTLPCLNPEKSVPVTKDVEQETTESIIKHGSNVGDNIAVTMSHDASQSSRSKPNQVDVELSFMSRSSPGVLESKIHGKNPKPDAEDSDDSDSEDSDSDNAVIDRFQILKEQETNRKLKTTMADEEDKPKALEMTNIVRSRHVSCASNYFQIFKGRKAEQVKKCMYSSEDSEFESEYESESEQGSGSEPGSDSDNDHQPRDKAEMDDDQLWADSVMTRDVNPQIETCAINEPGSPTSDWEHVEKED